MPIDRRLYPAGWKQIAAAIRITRARDRCECTGQCGHHRGSRCTERHGAIGRWQKGTIRLTAAHLCHCQPLCGLGEHLLSACQGCHLRIDLAQHLATRRRHRLAASAEATGGGRASGEGSSVART